MKVQAHTFKEQFVLRSPVMEDAPLLAAYFKKLFHESSEFLNFSANYYDDENVVKQQQFISSINADKGSLAIFVYSDNEVLGNLVLKNIGYTRASHRAMLAMGVLQKAQGNRIGSKLIQMAFAHSEQANILLIELYVRAFNHVAIHLYEKAGFIKHGEIKGAIFLNGKYVDEYIYSWYSPKFVKILME